MGKVNTSKMVESAYVIRSFLYVLSVLFYLIASAASKTGNSCYLGKIVLHGLASGAGDTAYWLVFPPNLISLFTRYIRSALVIVGIVPQFVYNIKNNKHAHAKPQGQAKYVDGREALIFHQAPESRFNVVFKHIFFDYMGDFKIDFTDYTDSLYLIPLSRFQIL
jgi:hypothetical protein